MGLRSSLKKIGKGIRRTFKDVVGIVEGAGKIVGSLLGLREEENAAQTPSGLTVNKSSASEKIPKLYGRRKLGGTRVYLSTEIVRKETIRIDMLWSTLEIPIDVKNKYLSSILVQCLGPVHSSSSVTVSDKAESTFGNTLRYTFHAGYPDQAADANFVSELAGWTENHRLQGLAYQAVRYTYDQDKYSGLPVFNSIIEGALLYDPRNGSTAYSDNFALVVLDYFRSSEYGVGIADRLIDFDSFKMAADLADVSYPSNSDSGVMVKRFACNLAVSTDQTPFDNIKQLVAESRAFLTQTAGKWRYVIQNDSTPDHTVTYDDIVGDISRSPNGARDKYNRVTVTYVDPDKEWDNNEATYPIDDAEYQGYLEEDNWEESHADITVDSCTNRYQALDIARQALLESRIGGAIAFEGQPWMIKVRCGDLLVMDVPGLRDGTLWRVASRKISADGEISFTCAAYDPSIFPWIELPDQPVVTAPELADSSVLSAPEFLAYLPSEWNESSVGSLTWTPSNSGFVHDYLIEIYRASDGIQVLSTTLAHSNDWADDYAPKLNLPYLAAGEYYATVRARNALTRSDVTTATFSVNVPAVGRVSGLVLVGDFDSSLSLAWTPLTSSSLKHYQVEIYDALNGTSLAKVSTASESITLGFELFKSIGLPRSFEVRVSGVNAAGEIGEASAIAVSKPAPIAPTIQVWASVNDLKLTLSAASNAKGVVVWLADESPVPKTDANQRYKGESLSITLDALEPLTEYQIAIASYDSFGLGTSSAHSVTTLRDAVADSIQQLTERDISVSAEIEDINVDLSTKQIAIDDINVDLSTKQIAIEKINISLDDQAAASYANFANSNEQMLLAAARAAEVRRQQQGQNDEYYRILNAVVEIDPSTGTITNRAYEYTNGKFSEAALLIDGVNASINLQATRIETAEGRLTDAESVLSVQAGLINQRATYTQLTETVANAITAIQPAYATNFNTGLDGWEAESGTAVYNAGAWLDLTLGDIASAMSYAGDENPVIQLTLARAAGAVWVGKIQYKTASHDYSSVHEMDINEISADGQQYTVSVDFGSVTDYTASTITGLRIILGATTADAYQIHSVQAGKRTAALAAIEGLQGRVSVAEQTIDAVNGQLSNYVTTTFYEQNTLTQNDVQQTLDSWNAQYSIIATLTQLDENGTITKANSAEQWIDGAEALISQIAQSTAQEEFGTRITNVEQTLDAQNGTIAQQITSIHKAETAADQLGTAALLSAGKAAAAAREQVSQKDTIALARSETKAVADDLQAEASRVDQLFVQYGESNEAAIQQEATARANADSSLAQTIETVQSKSNSNEAAIQQEATARANADSSLAQTIETVQSKSNSNEAAIQQEATARANADSSLAQTIETVQSKSNSNEAAIQQEATARANADSSLAQTIETVQSKSNSNEAAIQQEATARANADSSLAQSVESLSATVGYNKAEVDEYKRTAIGYCVDANGNPTSHETAASCELAGNTWMGESSIAEALRNVTVTGTNADGEAVEVSAGTMYQAILDADGKARATAAVMAIYGNQLAGIFANAGEDGSSLEFLANQMKFRTENGTKTPFSIIDDEVVATDLIVSSLRIPASSTDQTPVEVMTFDQLKGNKGDKGAAGQDGLDGTDGILPAPTGAAGLFANDDYLGYHDGDSWQTFIDKNGGFFFRDGNGNYVTNLENDGTLSVKGHIEAVSGAFSGDVTIGGKLDSTLVNHFYGYVHVGAQTVFSEYDNTYVTSDMLIASETDGLIPNSNYILLDFKPYIVQRALNCRVKNWGGYVYQVGELQYYNSNNEWQTACIWWDHLENQTDRANFDLNAKPAQYCTPIVGRGLDGALDIGSQGKFRIRSYMSATVPGPQDDPATWHKFMQSNALGGLTGGTIETKTLAYGHENNDGLGTAGRSRHGAGCSGKLVRVSTPVLPDGGGWSYLGTGNGGVGN